VEGALVATGAALLVVAAVAWPRLGGLAARAASRRLELGPTAEVLGSLALFDGASQATLERVAASVADERVEQGAVLIRQGAPADDVFVAIEGSYAVEDHGRRIAELGPGDWFGEIGLMRRSARTATVSAATAGRVWRIPGDVFVGTLATSAQPPGGLMEVIDARVARSAQLSPPGAVDAV
jgi:CRP-like cAMP-binding protein